MYLNFMGDNNVEQPCEHSVEASESEGLTHRWRLSPSTSDVGPLQTWIVLENAREAVCVIMFITFLSSFSMPVTRVSVQVQKMSLCCLPCTFKDSGGSKTLPVLFCRQHCCWAGSQSGPAGGNHWISDSATVLRPRVPFVFPQTAPYSRREAGNRVRFRPRNPFQLYRVWASSCNYELKLDGVTPLKKPLW